VIGYLPHRLREDDGAEDVVEGRHLPGRIDYVSFQYNELVYVLAIEKLLGSRCPARRPGCGWRSAS
jgi:NADH:ubiquinone oxidoreductase subunit D